MADCIKPEAEKTSAPAKDYAGVLDAIVANKRQEVAARQQEISLETLKVQVEPLQGFPFEAALRQVKPVHLITEIKPSSPSAGVLQAELDLDGVLAAYNTQASAISVLTDEKYFGGNMARLAEVSQQSPHPILCKDFILEEYPVYEARLAGAAAVLLIVKILDDETLDCLHKCIRGLGMTPVVEVQNDAELQRALAVGADVLLINNRDLSSFAISLDTTHELVKQLKASVSPEAFKSKIIISASGIASRADVEYLLPSAHCFLIGSSLMKQPVDQLPGLLAELAGR
jgi:indole-3-glycerol phosphate synthase / phosphoribosylanthranilate isomerase